MLLDGSIYLKVSHPLLDFPRGHDFLLIWVGLIQGLVDLGKEVCLSALLRDVLVDLQNLIQLAILLVLLVLELVCLFFQVVNLALYFF